ncbi:hypothetical protein [Rhizobium sp. P44RR-XXIV]|uniref:hypothetical protein n=1 Tax=Rhizobium sp. P44RR-XXIV TaxID=1921145 RepID=UPI0009870FE8|nr:hypothetical protein [Rhizobium sp. P44RR-XXIV]TIX89794.1 hypothetical protein BSK43_025065 [Rhizobium sp. P44RR-XXIV]
MKVHHSTQNYFSTPIRGSQQDADGDDSTPFTLPGGDGDQQEESQGPSISSSGVPSSISSGFWLSQIGATSSSASDGSTDEDDSSAASSSSSAASAKQSNQDILDEFAKWANMTPAEKIRAQYLDAHGLTEDSFKSLSADDQKAINDQIADEIKQKLGVNNSDDDKETDSASSALSLV